MLNSKSKQVGLVGTLLFHLVVFLLCLLSSIGYTSIEPPVGIEIQFVPQELEIIDKLNNTDKASSISSIKNEDIVENVIVEQEQNIQLPNEQDTLTLAKSDLENQSIKVSIELEDALSKLLASDASQINKDSLDNFSDDTIVSSAEKTKLDNTQDGYVLSNRQAVRKIKPNYSCEEFGTIVVRVWVNREGKTIKAEPGIRGTTEASTCLFTEAEHAALKTTWTPYFDAPEEIQVGQITYNFYKY